ncbi:MAG: translation elongation factor Ts [Zetaproteobacteria bacterium]|nr:translation elongation factor Ts [Zetaproteobacteria bacterium]
MSVTAAQVKELRQRTGVGMMECKKALVENSGDMDQAIVWLRERGMAKAAKKAGRTTAEGIVQVSRSADGKSACAVEINCETDFAAKNADFREFAEKVAKIAVEGRFVDVEALKAARYGESTVGEALTSLIATVGENMSLRRVRTLSVESGCVVAYSHMGGKIGSLVALQSDADKSALEEAGSDLAMHVAATAPKYLTRDQVQAAELDTEKDIIRKRLLEQGKPENIIEKALLGQVNKFYSDVCLVDQPFVKEPKMSVTAYLKKVDSAAAIADFLRFQLGEGIEVKKGDFAAEVADTLRTS